MTGDWRETWGRWNDTARRAGDSFQNSRRRYVEWKNRPRRPLIVIPDWVQERRLLIKWKLQEWWWRLVLRWAAITHPVMEWFWMRAAAAARRIDDARDKLAYRLKPIIWRIADWLERRTQAAAHRKSAIAAKLAALSALRVRPMVRAVEERVHVGAAVRTGREFGVSPALVLIALALVSGAVYLRLRMRVPPPVEATDDEIALVSSFLTGTGGVAPAPEDPQAWVRQVGAVPATPPKAPK